VNQPTSELDTLPRWVPPAVFAALTAIVFRAYLLAGPGEMLLGQDTLAAGIMFRSFFVEQYHALGRLPLWNPYLFGGVPTIEAGSGDILYPGSWLHFLLPMTSALAWKLILHVFLAGVFMYAAARAFGADRWVALFAGAAYQLAPNLVSLVWGGQDGKMYVITLFPASLWLLVSALRTGSLVRFLWLGVVAGLMILAHPQLAYYAYFALGLWALGALVAERKTGAKTLLARLGGGLAALAVGLAIAAIVLLPMYRYLRQDSPRAGPGLGYEKAASYSLNAEEMVNFVVPDFSGVSETYWGRNPLKHNSEYGGVLVFALGLTAIFALRGDRRRWGLGAMAAVALLYALGDTTPVFRLMYLAIPGLRNFRAPSLATFLTLTALIILAALLLQRIFRNREATEGRAAARVLTAFAVISLLIGVMAKAGGQGMMRAWFAAFGPTPHASALESNLPTMAAGGFLSATWCAIGVAVMLGWRRGLLGARAAIAILGVTTAFDLLRVDARYLEVVRYGDFFPEDPGIAALKQNLGPGERVLALGGTFPTEGHLATYGIPLVFGYHGNQLRWYDELTRRSVREGAGSDDEARNYWLGLLNGPVLRLLATRVVILPGKFELPGYELMGGNERLGIYRNPKALQAATVVPQVTVESDSGRQIARLWDSSFNEAAEVLAFSPVPEIGQGGGQGKAVITADGADSLSIEATTSGPSMLLVSRNWHPSWKATRDGAPASPVRVDYALLGVPLPGAGTHRVTLAYRPAIVATARRVSIAGWVIVLAASAVLLIRRRTAAHA
jgi:hypothetical protein